MMQEHMDVPWYMGSAEWLELILFWTAAAIFITLLAVSIVRQPSSQAQPLMPGPASTWRNWPETMPIVPIVDIGGMPLLQWLLIPPILPWLIRMTNTTQQVQAWPPSSALLEQLLKKSVICRWILPRLSYSPRLDPEV